MQCSNCSTSKLSTEYPRGGLLSPNCNHIPKWCTRCLLQYVPEHKVCPDCKCRIDKETISSLSSQLKLVTLEDLFEYTTNSNNNNNNNNNNKASDTFDLTVSLLGGDTVSFKANSYSSIEALQNVIEKHFKIEVRLQRIVFQGKELKTRINGMNAALYHYGITQGATVQLMKLMLALSSSSNMESINFRLQWGWEGLKKAYLDGMCFVYSGTVFRNYIDYKIRRAETGILHSGNIPVDRRISRHEIKVDLNRLSNDITHLFFVLSAVFVPTIAVFDRPGVALYDVAHPTVKLDGFNIETAANCQAVIMCCLKRTEEGGWQVIPLKQESEGTVFDYRPIQATIDALFRTGHV